MKKRRWRFESEAKKSKKSLPPLPLFGEGPQVARRTQAGGNVKIVQVPVARIRKLIDKAKHGTQQRKGLEAMLRERLAEGGDGCENGGGGVTRDRQKRASDDETIIRDSPAAAGGDDTDNDDGNDGGNARDDGAIETPTIGSGATMGGDGSARAA
eukprot:scaffold49433_cov36-Phaeocystis_antarctica.AAC.1